MGWTFSHILDAIIVLEYLMLHIIKIKHNNVVTDILCIPKYFLSTCVGVITVGNK